MTRRTERLNNLLREEISWIVARDMRDPRLSLLVTITRAEVTSDLRQAAIHVSVMGTAEEKRVILGLLQAATGFLQRELKPKLELRYVPALSFKLDESIEKGLQVQQLMDTLPSPERPAP
ncbi:MAG: 30S ribosome-binding factor RbfA [Chloroflexi bacterium]|nr:30S ribosome-binding factor RbfA [Chloroflexota bacterium]